MREFRKYCVQVIVQWLYFQIQASTPHPVNQPSPDCAFTSASISVISHEQLRRILLECIGISLGSGSIGQRI
jgi:hypothetical protein